MPVKNEEVEGDMPSFVYMNVGYFIRSNYGVYILVSVLVIWEGRMIVVFFFFYKQAHVYDRKKANLVILK